MTNIQPAGFIIADFAAIWGAGATEDAAWADLRNGMKIANVPHESEVDTDDTYCPRFWSEDTFKALPASAALVARVEECGGQIAYEVVDGVACTTDEADEAA